ncbi:hypothetical protein DNTS_007009 [Danionella cerebrum]|nr:hypothetical protein DNTS_007009 [Danionella translucida]TRY87975.1 hypothetical protein DNTS_007009 [Danionella translucida]
MSDVGDVNLFSLSLMYMTPVIMRVHPVLLLLLLQIVGVHTLNGLSIVANRTVSKPEDCRIELCPPNVNCTRAILNDEKSLCYLMNCQNNESCDDVRNLGDLFVNQDSAHQIKTQTSEPVLTHVSSGSNSSSNVTQPAAPEINVSTSTPTKLVLLPSNMSRDASTLENSTTTVLLPKPDSSTSIPTIAEKPTHKLTSTITDTTTPTSTSAQTSRQPSPTSPPSETNSTTHILSVPTTLPSLAPSPIPKTSTVKQSQTPPTTSMSSSSVVPTLSMNVPQGGKPVINVAGDALTNRLLNTSSLLAVLLFGLLFFLVTVALFLKQAYESYRRKDYTQVDYLINGMYADSGV